MEAALEAGHIIAYGGDDTNRVSNGILLRADIHTLFDLGELRIDAKSLIHFDEKLNGTIYDDLEGKVDSRQAPYIDALAKKFTLLILNKFCILILEKPS